MTQIFPGYFSTLGISFLAGRDFTIQRIRRSGSTGMGVHDGPEYAIPI
jgi:hypothetical protein